ncbi:MAG: YeiH family protein [Alphaproteobacteria bacterium]
MNFITGILICFVMAIVSQVFAKTFGGAYMIYALLLGMVLSKILYIEKFKDSINYTGKSILSIGVALLGARITFVEISTLGFDVVIAVALAVFATILFGYVVSRLMGLNGEMGIISGGSTAICGASAAMAVSSVFPHNKKIEQQTLFIVVGVNILSTVAMVLYPMITTYLGYNDLQTGVFLGGSIHDVAQVVGAGLSVNDNVGDIATITKLFRVALLLPIVFTLAYIVSLQKSKAVETKAPFPVFLIGFLALVLLNSFEILSFTIPVIDMTASSSLAFVSKILLTMAVFALGMKTSPRQLLSIGPKAISLLVMETVFIAILILMISSYIV